MNTSFPSPHTAVPFPPIYALDPKDTKNADLLSDRTLLGRLLEQYAPTSTADVAQKINKWTDIRGFGLWEYGFTSSGERAIASKIKEAANAFEGELPKVC